ncbi:MAG: type II toxin-antitoxin system PemK/MazF family toxin [Verrucomicrobia bacterium]|nr:type II toxin-antitoxin system PemK/MazF family toxin [Verrucomicrobiota bacterium]
MSLPSRGEVWLCDLGMIAKVRPVLVVSVPFGEEDYALFHVVPHTTAVRNSQFEALVSLRFLKPGVFNIQGSQSVPRAPLIRHLGTLHEKQMALIEDSFRRWLKL